MNKNVITNIIKELTNCPDIIGYGGKSLVAEMVALYDWQPMETAPRDGTPILAECSHDADSWTTPSGKSLTTYAAHAEEWSRVDDGYHVVVWGGEYSESDWEASTKITVPNWWFLNNGDFEIVANPIKWKPIV